MCAEALSVDGVFLLGSVAMLVIVLLTEACAYLYRRQATPETLDQRLSNS